MISVIFLKLCGGYNMATNKKGQFAYSIEYAKHLRYWGKRLFWKKERAMSKENINEIKKDVKE